jgi:class 3 adenylate cyclase
MSVTAPRTNGFLFADLREYTRYVDLHGDHAGARLLESYRALVRAAVRESGGAEIKTEGDSFYVVFPSASAAVQCGLAILAAAATPGGPPIQVGIGVHAGETVATAEGYVGSAVNVAARVCSQAQSGELLVTDTVRALTRTFLPVRFVDRKVRKLKGIAEPVTIYRVAPADEGATTDGREPSGAIGQVARVAFLLVGLLIGGAAVGYVLLAARSTPGPGSASPSIPVATASFPTIAESDLLDQVPSSIRDRCVRAEDQDDPRVAASLRCDLELSAEADTVWYQRYESGQAMANHVLGTTQAQRLQVGTCGPGVPRADGTWNVGSTFSGRLLCYQADGDSWLVWTYDADRILARVTRGGDSTEDWSGLLSWWRQMRLFMR